MSAWIGIDPGISGGIFLNGSSPIGFKIPETDRDLWDIFRHLRDTCSVQYAVLEKVHAMPVERLDKISGKVVKQGATSIFTFGDSFGLLRGMLVASEIPFELVAPQTWQKMIGMSRVHGEQQEDYKRRLKSKAQNMFPTVPIIRNTADAALLSHIARILWMNVGQVSRGGRSCAD